MANPGTETRALTAALAAPTPFASRATSMALRSSERLVERLAPEHDAIKHSRGLGSLAFVDRLLTPWMAAADHPLAGRLANTSGRSSERAQSVSWVFPRPWYQDELDWMAAQREGAMMSTQVGGQRVVMTAAQGMMARPRLQSSLDYVAPSMTAQTPQTSLRAWSPQVTFRAAQAAEVLAATVAMAERAGLTSAERSPVLEGLAYVAPMELMSEGAPRAASSSAASSAAIVRTIAQLSAAQAVSRATSAEAARAAVQETAPIARVSDAVAESYRTEQVRAYEEMRANREARITGSPDGSRSSAPVTQVASLAATSPAAAQAMRAVELLARAALEGTVAPASGPRVAMPAGLGGALVGFHAASTAAAPAMAPVALLDPAEMPEVFAGGAPQARARSFAPTYAAAAPAMAAAPALSAIAAERPAAMSHLAWADRWLARMAGASQNALAALDVGREHTVAVPRILSRGAPEVVFIIPERPELEAARPAPVRAMPTIARSVAPAPSPTAPRFDDGDAVPDEVFAAIARSARPRTARGEAPPPPPMPTLVPAPAADVPAAVRLTLADQIAMAAPGAPAAGLHAGLASSPMAAAIASLLPMPAAPVFDPRAMFGAGLVSAYVSAPLGTSDVARINRAPEAPTLDAPSRVSAWLPRALAGLPFVAPWTAATPSVADELEEPAEPSGLAARAPATSWILPDVVEAPANETRGAQVRAPRRAAPVRRVHTEEPTWSLHAPVLAPFELAATDPVAAAALAGLPAHVMAPPLAGEAASMVTVRFPDGSTAEVPAAVASQLTAGPAAAMSSPLAMVDAGSWTARPGMTAELAQGFAVETERSAADLAFDFVSPQLILAARVYGFGAAEAAQAARLAVAGPAGLSAMASALDLTFLRALHVAAEADQAPESPRAARAPSMPTVAPGYDAVAQAAWAAQVAPSTMPPTAVPGVVPSGATAAPSGTVFGVPRRLPRGAFYWPAGVAAALGLEAEVPQGAAISTVAALELLAAGAVAEMGALVSPSFGSADAFGDAELQPLRGAAARAPQMVPPSVAGGPDPFAVAEASDVADVLEVPSADRGRFESVYLSLARSTAGQSLSPSVRAARALAIVSGMDAGGTTSAQERARAAWTVMPVVFGGGEAGRELPPSTVADAAGAPARRAGDHPLAGRLANLSLVRGDDDLEQFASPMSGLAARAGEAIGSYVQPTVREVGGASSGAVRGEGRTERSFPEPGVRDLVRTGRPFSRVGGGETEIPAWFESAARRMLEQRGLSETISVAELALVASAPSRQIAAATRGSDPSPAMTQAPPGEAGAAQGEKPDIDKLAGDVYTAVLDLIAVARQRSGDPWV